MNANVNTHLQLSVREAPSGQRQILRLHESLSGGLVDEHGVIVRRVQHLAK